MKENGTGFTRVCVFARATASSPVFDVVFDVIDV